MKGITMLDKAKKFVSDHQDTIANSAALGVVFAFVATISIREKRRINNAVIDTRKSMISEVSNHFNSQK